MSIDTSQIKAARLNLWRATIDAELQQTIATASELRQKISESKTTVKRNYYNKKFQKVSDTVKQLLAVKSQLPPAEIDAPTPIEESTTSDQAVTTAAFDPGFLILDNDGTTVTAATTITV